MSDTPTPPTLAEARGRVISQAMCCEDAAVMEISEVIGNARTELARDVDTLIAAAQREAAGRIWCALCHKIVLNGPNDIHTCYDADAVQRQRIAELEAEVARLTEWKRSASEVLWGWDA